MRERLPIPSVFARLADDRGQTLVVAALCMVVLLGFMGLAIDIGNLRYQKRALQTVADAAALAAAIEVRICGTTSNCPAMKAAAQQAVAENGYTVTTTLTNCAGTAGPGFTLTVNNPPCSLSTDPNAGAPHYNYAEAIVTENVPTYFARILGISTVPISARAEAARGVGGPCIYALDPAGAPAIQMTAALGMNIPCGIVDESSAANAFSCAVGLAINVPSINITGGASGLLCTTSPPPHTGVPVPQPADPLAYLPAPAAASGTCGTSTGSPYTGSSSQVLITLGLGSNIVFHPGVYCGGISIIAGLLTNITFTPGVYILRQGPGLLGTTGGLSINISAISTITGNGVMFYNQGTIGSFSIGAASLLGLSTVSLSAATSGEYGGVLFFQAHGVTALGNFSNILSSSLFTGAIYLPDAPLDYDLNAVSASYNILVAKDITFTGAILSGFGNNYATLQSGSPLNGDNVELVQ
ncbi:hypothetical protein HNQ77_000589 [Silvibacterium bohemicum]|uniref:Flp pilus-assembly TadG-like N-terminal domain-containing protein n=1 Tax=Silvibacterium bohemicum TaxID=1577686 RepID=A0A841JUJ2_9BACT|nr:pilus assembly protein TadG-related protein [Silvibacterium bohemicum]MBB6142651.1 hypothetical protein [Silvibacterium bohemicum]